MIALAVMAPCFRYIGLIAGLVVAGTGAGVLNGEVVKVGMTVFPPERAPMASGVAGTGHFTSIAIGFAALGAVLARAFLPPPCLSRSLCRGPRTGSDAQLTKAVDQAWPGAEPVCRGRAISVS
jgi:hypothetical protein